VRFHDAIAAAKAADPYGAAVTVYPEEDYRGARLFVTADGKAGFALKGDDLVSVFKHPESDTKGFAFTAMGLGVQQGARRLDAFDTVLPRLYERGGFEAVARIPWNDEYKPDGWDYQRFGKYNGGRPDVVFMAFTGSGATYKPGAGKTVSDYDAGVAAQIDALKPKKKSLVTQYLWAQAKRNALARLTLPQRAALARAEAEKTLGRLRKFDPSQPRDDDGKWTDGGGSAGSGTRTEQETEDLRSLLLVSERPKDDKLDRWRAQLDQRMKELEDQGEAGNHEDGQLHNMHAALNKYMQESEEELDKETVGLNTVYDGTGDLRSAAFTYVDKNKIAIIDNFGALDQVAGVKTLEMVTQKFASKVDRIEAQRIWSDDTATISIFEAAGFKLKPVDPDSDAAGPYVTMFKSDLPGGGYTTRQERLKQNARWTAEWLDFDPAQIEWTDEDRDFSLGGHSYKYAGSYSFGEPGIMLYSKQINNENVVGVTAHEIGHRKYDLLVNKHKAEYDAVMKEPGPPPDPDGRYYWQKQGGSAAVMKPDGTLRPPYDTMYPIYQEMARIREMDDPTLAESDGITNYSKSYWEEWNKGNVKTVIAEHETLAEMSKWIGTYGEHHKDAKQPWRDLYALMDKIWKEAPAEVRVPSKAAA
jgi:hypothetical protein